MTEFEVEIENARRSPNGYVEFLRVPSMSVGAYVLPAGGTDRQRPHDEDEVYYVLRGRATFQHRSEERTATAGVVFYVPAAEAHHFHSITEELVLLVVFAPAERRSVRPPRGGAT